MKPVFCFITGLLLLSPLTPVVPGAQAFPLTLPTKNNARQQGVDNAIKRIQQDLQHWDEKLANPDPMAVFKSYNDMTLDDVRRKVLQPFFSEVKEHPQYAELRTRLFAIRVQATRRGLNPYRWQDWEYDGQQPGADLNKYFEGIEMRANKLYSNLGPTNGYNPKMMEGLTELNGILAKPEFSSNPVLKMYKETYLADQLIGIKSMLQHKRVWYAQSQLIDIRNRLKNMTKGSQTQLQQIKDYTKQTLAVLNEYKANGGQLAQQKISVNPRDPLAQELTLQQVWDELQKIMALK